MFCRKLICLWGCPWSVHWIDRRLMVSLCWKASRLHCPDLGLDHYRLDRLHLHGHRRPCFLNRLI